MHLATAANSWTFFLFVISVSLTWSLTRIASSENFPCLGIIFFSLSLPSSPSIPTSIYSIAHHITSSCSSLFQSLLHFMARWPSRGAVVAMCELKRRQAGSSALLCIIVTYFHWPHRQCSSLPTVYLNIPCSTYLTVQIYYIPLLYTALCCWNLFFCFYKI